jgi:hypothetical protein
MLIEQTSRQVLATEQAVFAVGFRVYAISPAWAPRAIFHGEFQLGRGRDHNTLIDPAKGSVGARVM